MRRSKTQEALEVVRGDKEVEAKVRSLFARAKRRIDICCDKNGLSLAMKMATLSAQLSTEGRGPRVRLITEITRDNRAIADQLLGLVEMRHLEGLASNFAVSDLGEFLGTVVIEGLRPMSELITSNASSVAEQYERVFESLWSRATPAEARLDSLEEWEPEPEVETKLLEGQDQILSHLIRMADSWDEVVACVSLEGLGTVLEALGGNLPSVMSIGGEGSTGIRWLTFIGEGDAELMEGFLERGVNVRHASRLPPLSFVCTKSNLLAAIEASEGRSILQNVLASTDTAYVSHFRSLFEEMWKDGVDARKRLDEIASGAELSSVRVIENPHESLRVAWELIGGSKEILLMFSTPRAFLRQVNAGAFVDLKSVLDKKEASMRILIPYEAEVVPILERVRHDLPGVDFRVTNENLKTKISILISDRRRTLVVETRDDEKEDLVEALGMATYAESKSLAASYAAIFENIWKQTEMYDKLKLHEQLQSDFVNVAAHELRTPVQAIINYAELATTNSAKKEEYYTKLLRNVTRLQKLTEEILDAARIEGGTLRLNKGRFDIDAMVAAVVDEQRIAFASKGVSLVVVSPGRLEVSGDRGRLSQVVSNLLSNAAKFTEKGSITVSVQERRKENLVRISVADTGTGIDPSIVPRLFSRFVANSQSGTGLGLYISKNIVEEHGGRIWVERNVQGEGATFAFEIPIRNPGRRQHSVV